MPKMDGIDRAILNRIQSDFPAVSRPYVELAKGLHLSEDELIRRVDRLKAQGIIRRIGGNFVPAKLGFVSTLCAARVPAEKIEAVAKTVGAYPGVTHSYLRENAYNLWFTFIAPSMALIDQYLSEISQKTGGLEIISLPATKVFKIKAHFEL